MISPLKTKRWVRKHLRTAILAVQAHYLIDDDEMRSILEFFAYHPEQWRASEND